MKILMMLMWATAGVLPLFAADPYAAEPRRVIEISEKGWDRAVSPDASLDLTKLPALEWNKPGARVKTARGNRFISEAVDLKTRKPLNPEGPFVEWYRKKVTVDKAFLKDHAAFFYICKARYGFTLFVNGQYVAHSWQACCEKEMEVTRFLKSGENEIVFGITTLEGMYDPVKNCARAPFYAYGDKMRWEGPVRLMFRPKVFIDDVFVETFYATKEAVYHLTLKNVSDKAETVRPLVRVSPEEDVFRPHLEIEGDEVKVPAGGEIEVTYRRTWPKDCTLLLWDVAEGNQWMYLARCTLLDDDGEFLDRYDQTYGFRTVEARGRDIFLNGERLFLSRWSMMGCLNDFEHWEYHRWIRGKADRNAVRYHLGSQALWMVPSGDKKGIIQIPEFGCMFFSAEGEHNPIDPDSLDEFCKSRCRWWRNRPSAIIYSLENETVWNSLDPKWDAFCTKYLATMRKYAPHVLYQADAGNTWNGKLDINNLHYPEGEAGTLRRAYPNAGFQLPNDLQWVDPVNGSKEGGWRTNPFDWSKPVVIGEFYCFPNPGFAGDRLFDPNLYDFEDPAGSKGIDYPSPLAQNPGEEMLRMMCTWYRVCGFAGLNPWVRNHSYALDPTILDPLEFRASWPSGGTFTRQIAMINDGGCPVNAIAWTLDGEGFHADGKMKVQVNQGSNLVTTITCALPSVTAPLTLTLKAKACFNQFEQARLHQTIHVLPTRYDLSDIAAKIGIIGADETTLAALGLEKAVKLDVTLPDGVRAVYVAPDALRPAHRKLLDALFARGGTAVIAHQHEWAPYRSELPAADLGHAATRAFVRSAGHPVLEGIADDQFFCWGADNVLSVETFQKPIEGDATAILECGGIRSLKWTPLVETKVDAGRAILDTFPKACDDPIVLKIRANALRYAVASAPRAGVPLAVAAGTNTQVAAFLDKTFVRQEAKTDAAKVLLIDASAKVPSADIAAVLKRGGTVWLHNANPTDFLRIFGEKAAARVVFAPTPKGVLFGPKVPGAEKGLLNGVSNEDLAWCIAPVPGEQWGYAGAEQYWRSVTKTCEPPAWCVTADPTGTKGVRLLTRPGFLAEVTVGSGRVLVDCLPWEVAVQKEPERTVRTVSQLVRNLGCVFKPVVKPKYSFRKLDLAKFCNMGYWDEVAGDGKGGWTDQGRNDMRMFLINHVGRNDYEETGMPTPVPPFPTEQVFNDVPFHLTAPKSNGGKGVISLGSGVAPKLPTEAKGIPVNAKFELMNVVHASAWMQQKPGKPIAKFVLNYEDGTTADVFVNAIEHICDWHGYQGGANCKIAWSGANKVATVTVNQSAFRNPHPEKTVKTIDVVGALHHAQYVILGITLATELKPLGEFEPKLVLKADFTKPDFFNAYFHGKNFYSPDTGTYGTNGVSYGPKGGRVVGIPDKHPLRSLPSRPFEIRLSFTLNEPCKVEGRIFDAFGLGCGLLNGRLRPFDNRMFDEVLIGKPTDIVFRYDSQNVWVWANGHLCFTADAGGYGFMDQDFHHMRWCNVPMTLHKLEFYELMEKK